MKHRRLDELEERVDALASAAVGAADTARLDARLAAIEEAIRRLDREDGRMPETQEAMAACRELVGDHVPAGARIAVASEGGIPMVALDRWSTVGFPESAGGREPHRGFGHGVAAIANLEAQRTEGTRYLLLPEPAREWMRRLPQLGEHLNRYRLLADEHGAGLLFDVGAPDVDERDLTVAGHLDQLAGGDRSTPILDWTDLDLAAAVPDRNVFTPPDDYDELPHLDATIEIVVVGETSRRAEARRVASGAVVQVSALESGGLEVVEVERIEPGGGRPDVALVVVVATDDADDPWRARIEEALRGQEGVVVVAGAESWAAAADADVAVLVEPGVLPLPGCLEALADSVTSGAHGDAAAVKLLASSGALEAAGRMVFADGSWADVAAGEPIDASWHEYVRPVCAATGMLAVTGAAARSLPANAGTILELSAEAWAGGTRLVYQPAAAAVRASRSVADGGDAGSVAAWEPALAARPERPTPLDEPAWRLLLTHDDPGEAWR